MNNIIFFLSCISEESPTPVLSDLSKLVINYNSNDFSYLDGYAANSNVIQVETVVPDTEGGQLDANTGLAYNQKDNEILVHRTRLSNNIRRFDRSLSLISEGIATAGEQAISFDPINEYYLDWQGSLRTYDTSGTLLTNENFSFGTSGSIFYDWVNDRFLSTVDGGRNIYIIEKVAGVWSKTSEIIATSQEGVSIDLINNTIYHNTASGYNEIDFDGTILNSFVNPLASMNSVNEGLEVDPTDGTLWKNSDQYFHGSIVSGNRCWHLDPKKVYDKYLRFPHQLKWSDGIVTGLVIEGQLHREKLTGNGTWESPIIDFGSYTMQQSLSNYSKSGDGTLSFRGSDTVPTTTATTIFPFDYYDPSQSNDGWGATVPSSYSSTPQYRYMQIKITR